MEQTFRIVTILTARKALKRLPKNLRQQLIEKISRLSNQPTAGEPLNPPLNACCSLHTALAGSQYPVLYYLSKENYEIVFVYAGTRENFYREVRRLNLRRAG